MAQPQACNPAGRMVLRAQKLARSGHGRSTLAAKLVARIHQNGAGLEEQPLKKVIDRISNYPRISNQESATKNQQLKRQNQQLHSNQQLKHTNQQPSESATKTNKSATTPNQQLKHMNQQLKRTNQQLNRTNQQLPRISN